jgi:hypothetical protein
MSLRFPEFFAVVQPPLNGMPREDEKQHENQSLFYTSEGHVGDNKSWYSSGLNESSIVGFRILRQCNVIVTSNFEVLRQIV